MAVARARLVLAAGLLAALTSAERDLEEASGNESAKEPPDKVEKLRSMVDPEGSICDSYEIKALIKGDAGSGTAEAQSMFKAIQEIPWHTVTGVQDDFMKKSQHKIDKLTLEGETLRKRIERKRLENAWTAIDENKVNELFYDAVKEGFKERFKKEEERTKKKNPWTDFEQVAKLTRCGATRVSGKDWQAEWTEERKWPNPPFEVPKPAADTKPPSKLTSAIRRLPTVTAPKRLPETINRIFKELSVNLYGDEKDTSKETGRVYVDTHKFESMCCKFFGLEGEKEKCAGIGVDADQKCDDICRECIDKYLKPKNAEQGFSEATSEGSVEEMSNELQTVLDRIDKLQSDRETCTTSMEEISAFRKEIDAMQVEIHGLKKNYEECKGSLWAASDAADDTAALLAESQEKLEKLEQALAKSEEAKEKILPLVKKAEEEIAKLQKLLEETKIELEETAAIVKKLTAASNVIVGLKEKVSALLMQMVATFEAVVAKRIEKAGLEDINFEEVLGTFPEDIRKFEDTAFGTLDESVGGLTGYCREAENMMKLKDVEDHPNIQEFCSAFEEYTDEKIGTQLTGAIQAHIDEFRDWFKKTSEEYQKFKEWMASPARTEEGKFEPLGLRDARLHFSETDFFKEYLAKWERETGTFYQAYDKLLQSLGERADRQSHLMVQEKETQQKFVAEEKKLKSQLEKIAKVEKTITKVKGVKKAEEKVLAELEETLKVLEEDAEKKQVVMDEAIGKFDESWQALVKFHEQRTSLTMLFEDVFKQMREHHEALIEKMARRSEAARNTTAARRARPSRGGRKAANRTRPTHRAKAARHAKSAHRAAQHSDVRTLQMHGADGAGQLIGS